MPVHHSILYTLKLEMIGKRAAANTHAYMTIYMYIICMYVLYRMDLDVRYKYNCLAWLRSVRCRRRRPCEQHARTMTTDCVRVCDGCVMMMIEGAEGSETRDPLGSVCVCVWGCGRKGLDQRGFLRFFCQRFLFNFGANTHSSTQTLLSGCWGFSAPITLEKFRGGGLG